MIGTRVKLTLWFSGEYGYSAAEYGMIYGFNTVKKKISTGG